MCRLLGYATNGINLSLKDIIGEVDVAQFRSISKIHNDGWGVSLLSQPPEGAHRRDGGAPTPETASNVYRSTVAAHFDSAFETFVERGARGGLFHLRLASSNLPLILENQQPFFANGLSFIHNGDISDEQGRNIVDNRDFDIDEDLLLETGGKSDSAIFFSVVLQHVGQGLTLAQSVAQAVADLRKEYPKSSYNCMVQSQDEMVCLRASGRTDVPARIGDIYARYGQADYVADYRVIRYKEIQHADRSASGVVIASSGFEQSAEDGWKELHNDQMLVASNQSGEYSLREL
ncbi:MAG: class II glutamine amidotransferase [Bifidobacterium sp.]|jgi:predicted glutamine amidotransferase|nr:class II glutamine amidotransferase [Bifidobacterium sp.]MCH4175348.1 class II glutamine amidotransferase [Bifidobacterium sp.]